MTENQENGRSTAQKRSDTKGRFIAGGVLCAVGLSLLLWGMVQISVAQSSNEWPRSEGFVVRSEVKSRRDSSKGRTRRTYHADIEYEFKVFERYFRGTQVAIGDFGSSSSEHAEEITNRYPTGSKVTVFFNPENPSDSLLEPGFQLQALFLPGAGAAFLSFGILIFTVRTSPKRERGGEERLKGLSNGPILPR